MVLRIKDTDRGDVFIDKIDEITLLGVTGDYGLTIENEKNNMDKALVGSHFTHSQITIYNYEKGNADKKQVVNMVMNGFEKDWDKFRTVIFTGPAFLMSDDGKTITRF